MLGNYEAIRYLEILDKWPLSIDRPTLQMCAESLQQAGWRPVIFYSEEAKIKILCFTKIYTNLLWACIRSTYTSDMLIIIGTHAQMLQFHSQENFPDWSPDFQRYLSGVQNLSQTRRNIQLVLVKSGITGTNADLHCPTKRGNFFCTYFLCAHENYIKKKVQAAFLPKPILLHRKIQRHDYLKKLL